MSNEQKLREALQAISHIDDTTNHSVDASAALDRIGQIARQALALPTADHIPDAGGMVVDHFPDATKMIETAAPVGDQEVFERTMMDKFGWQRNDFKLDDFGYFDGHTDTAWMAWQARAALSAGDAVDGPLIDEGSKPALTDAQIEAVFERYKGTPGRELRLTIGRALLAEASAAPALLIGWTDTTGPADIRWKEGLRKCDLPDKAPVYVGQPAAPALASWQPIETAPKDGSDCWLLVEEEVRRGFWVEIEFEERRDLDGRYIDQTDDYAYWMDKDSGDSLEPTMFYPITKPLPPSLVDIDAAMRKDKL